MPFNSALNQTQTNWIHVPNSTESTMDTPANSDSQTSKLELIAVILAVVCTLIGNHLVLFAFINNFKMRTVTNAIVVSMCIVDIVSAVSDTLFYVVPVWFHPELATQYTFCKFSIFMYEFSTVAAALSMFGTAVDRYLYLVQTSLGRLSIKKAQMMIGCVWFQALVAALPWDLFSPSSKASDLALFACQRLPFIYNPSLNIPGLSIFLKIWCILIPYLTTIWMFSRILQSARRRQKIQIDNSSVLTRSKTERFAVHSYARTSVTAVILFSIYLISATPFVLGVVYTFFSEYTNIPTSFVFAVYYCHRLKGAVLPFMYLLRNRNVLVYFQRKVKYWYRKKDYFQSTRNSIALHRNKSSFGIVYWYRQSQNGARADEPSAMKTKRVHNTQTIRMFYTKNAKKELQSSFTDLSSFNEDKENKVVKETSVEEAGMTAKKAAHDEEPNEVKTFNMNKKRIPENSVDSQPTSMCRTADIAGIN